MNTSYNSEDEIRRLHNQIDDLQHKLVALRASRRILMVLLSVQSRDSQMQMQQLELENRRLRQSIKRHAGAFHLVRPWNQSSSRLS